MIAEIADIAEIATMLQRSQQYCRDYRDCSDCHRNCICVIKVLLQCPIVHVFAGTILASVFGINPSFPGKNFIFLFVFMISTVHPHTIQSKRRRRTRGNHIYFHPHRYHRIPFALPCCHLLSGDNTLCIVAKLQPH